MKRWKNAECQVLPLYADTFNYHWLQLLHNVVSDYFSIVGKPKHEEIFYRRCHYPNDRETLEDLGNEFGLTKERIRQLAALCSGQLCYLLKGKILKKPHCKLAPAAIDFIKQGFLKHLCGDIILRKNIEQDAWEHLPEEQRHYTYHADLIAEVLGYVRMSYKDQIYYVSSKEPAFFEKLCKAVKDHLYDSACAVPLNALTEKFKRPVSTIKLALSFIPALEEVSHECYQIRGDALKSKNDLAYRILKEHGKPMYIKDLADKCGVSNGLSCRISGDERFKCVGKTGMWGLADWRFNSDTIIELIRKTISYINRPATFKEILACINLTRPEIDMATLRSVFIVSEHEFKWVDTERICPVDWKDYQGIERPVFKHSRKRSAHELHKIICEAIGDKTLSAYAIADKISPLLPEYKKEHIALRLYTTPCLEKIKTGDSVYFKRKTDYHRYLQPRVLKKDTIVETAVELVRRNNGKILMKDLVKAFQDRGITTGSFYPVMIKSDRFVWSTDKGDRRLKWITLK